MKKMHTQVKIGCEETFCGDDQDEEEGDDDKEDDHNMVMMGVTIRQGPVVHVVETAVVLGAGGWTEVEVRPGQVDDDHDDALDDEVHILMLL